MATARKIFPFVLLGLACFPAWGQTVKNASPITPQVFDKPGVTPAGADAVPQAVNPSTYLIGPEDVLKIEVFREDQLSRIVSVRPDGKITLLLVGYVQVEGLTP
ncbi:MAG: polysaccharide biosynthesis/export family protein [Bryobacteraceae bacterium]